MPRRALVLSNEYPYHVMSRSNNKEWFYVSIDRCWEVFSGTLTDTAEKHGVCIYAFVLMSNHFHLILSTPKANLGDVMRDFLTTTSKAIQKEAQRKNHVFGARYKWSLLNTAYSVAYVFKYVFRNPVRAGLCAEVQKYDYTSISAGDRLPSLPLACGVGNLWRQVPRWNNELLGWLNQPTPVELEKQISRGLRRETFRFSTDNGQQNQLRRLRSLYGVEPDMTATF